MTHREQLAILALLIVLLALAILFPRPAASDAPVAASRIPASEFESIRSADPLASGQASISADPSLRTQNDSGPISEAAQSRLATWASDDAIVYPRTLPVVGSSPILEEPAPSPSASKRVPTPTPVRSPAPQAAASTAGHSIRGSASWYRYVVGGAAAGPRLRSALGPGWRGHSVTVCAATCVRVRLSDWMAADRLVDLDSRSFAALAPLSQGLTEVTISWQ